MPRRPPFNSTASASTPANSWTKSWYRSAVQARHPNQMMAALRGSTRQFCLVRSASLGTTAHHQRNIGYGTMLIAARVVRNWYRGLEKIVLNPPPDPHVLLFTVTIVSGPVWKHCRHAWIEVRVLRLIGGVVHTRRCSSGRFVPPTAVTFGSARRILHARNEGVPLVGLLAKAADTQANPPLSPELATKVMPCALPCWNRAWICLQNSGEIDAAIIGRCIIQLALAEGRAHDIDRVVLVRLPHSRQGRTHR